MGYEGFKTAEREGWDARASQYNNFTGQVTTRMIPTLMAMAEIAPNDHILDLCCGTGRVAGMAIALGANAEGIDISPSMVKTARTAFPNSVFDIGDAESIPRHDDTFDAVICNFGLMHVSDTEALFQEIERVLKPSGRVALSHWIGPPESDLFRIVFGTIQRLADMSTVPPSPPPFALSTPSTLQTALEQAGFSEISIKTQPLLFTAPEGEFANYFRRFAARAAVILDAQSEAVLNEIYSSWESQMEEYVVDGMYRISMPALAASAVFEGTA